MTWIPRLTFGPMQCPKGKARYVNLTWRRWEIDIRIGREDAIR